MSVELSRNATRTNPGSQSGGEYVALQQQTDLPGKSPDFPKISFQSKVNEKWVFEIACCVGMLATLASIIGFLLVYDGKAIPDWPYGITVNTVLSLLSVVLNACLISAVGGCISQWKWISFNSTRKPLTHMNTYDSASRGPWGCIMFLFTSNLGQYATIGALATILAAGIGPFVQQMVKVENNRILSDDPATLARAQSYSYTPSGSTDGNEPPTGMIGSIYASVFNCLDSDCSTNSSASYSTVIPSCPTGECDFPRFTTLAVCSSCSEISHLLSSSTKSCGRQAEKRSVPLHTYSLPNGLNTSFHDNWNSTFLKTATGSSASKMRSIAQLPEYGNTTMMDFTAIKYRLGDGAPEVNATQCALYWCTKSISARMTGNKLKETHLETRTDTSANLGNVNCTDEQYNNILVTDFTEPMAYFPVNRLFENLAAGMTISVRRSGKASQQNMFQIAHWFDHSSGQDYDGGATYKIGSAYNTPLDESLGVVNGTSYQLETQIKVRWAWVTFPAVLMVMAGGFLVVTILQTRQSGVPSFKSSSIPLVCLGLDNEIQESLRLVNDPVAKDDASSTVMAKFVKSDDMSWRMEADAKEEDRRG
ncbi:hypothetical protein N7467_010450 [Penicillium canescens]|nr:hypothetical protein N7467_010450 [Penicillium canescens]